MFITPIHTASSNVPFGKSLIESADVNTPFTNFSTYLGNLDDQRASGIITSNTTLVANRDIYNPVNATAGAVTITLPAGSAHTTQPIVIDKVDVTSNAVIIQRAGSDVIEDPYNQLLVPTATSFSLICGRSKIVLYPVLQSGVYVWRVIDFNETIPAVRAYKDNAQTITTSSAVVTFNVNSGFPSVAAYDPLGYVNTSTGVYTAPRNGTVLINSSVTVDGGTASTCVVRVRLNTNLVAEQNIPAGSLNSTAAIISSVTAQVKVNAGDLIDIASNVGTGSRNLFTTGSARQRYTFMEIVYV